MARFSGKQFKGANRVMRQTRRAEAEVRQEAHRNRMAAVAALLEAVAPGVEVKPPVKKTRGRRAKKDVPVDAFPDGFDG